MKKALFFLLVLILLGAFAIRLYRFNGPVADWHSWRQADTSAVSRNFIKYGFDFLHPRFDDLSNVPSNYFDNPNGYRFVEFPIYNAAQAGLFKLFGYFTIEQWGRLVTIFSSLLAIMFLYLIVKKHQSVLAGLLTAFFYAFLPYSIYYGRTILPDQSMIMALLGGVYFFDLWLEKDIKFRIYNYRFILSLIFIILALLLKPFALFFTLPIIYLVLNKFGFSFLKRWQLWLFLIISILPLIFWRIWMLQYPEGIPRSDWLFNASGIRFKGAYFSWIFEKRISNLILGSWGLPILILGFLTKTKLRNYLFFLSFMASSLLYIIIIAGGNVQHDYYQILILPSIAIFIALGSEFLLNLDSSILRRIIGFLIFTVCILFMFAFSWYSIRAYYNINNPAIVRTGQAVNSLIPATAKVIAPYEGDTSFLYQINRQGWASLEQELPKMVEMGADYLVIVSPTSHNVGKIYKIISYTDDYILVDLHQKP